MDDNTKKDFILLFNQGFEEVVLPEIERLDNRLDKIDQTLDKVDQRLNRVEQTLEAVETRLETVETRLETVETRLDVVERKLDQVVDNQIDHKKELATQKERLKKLETISLSA